MNLTIIALIMIVAVIASGFVKRLPTPLVLCLIPIACALILGYNISEISDMSLKQISNSLQTAGYMIVFAMIYFNMLTKTGMFSTLIGGIIKLFRGTINVYAVMVITSILGAIGMLTAQVNTAYLILFPMMLPIYKKMQFDRKSIMIIAQTGIASMCFVPWGIAVVNSSMFAGGVDPMDLSKRLIPVALCFIPVIILQWLYFAYEHKKNGRPMKIEWNSETEGVQEEAANALVRPQLFWFNLALFLVVIAMLVWNQVPSYMVFLAAAFITAVVNYPKPKEYNKLLTEVSPRIINTLMMLIGISTFLGVLNGTGMVGELAGTIVTNVPQFMTRYIHIILAMLLVFIIRFLPNKFINSMYPVLISVGATYGLAGTDVIAPFVCNMSLATGSSPFTAATHVGTGLMEIDTTEYCNKSAVIQGISNILILVIAILFGAVR